ncbi:DUF58 domain-containing protein [Chromobacterium sp. IIBBL 290-4]|uniref:DUF58 domain-containing protein n=1 Tax=Chromobacterium sp. IIBBL 290-4 TaxID=2953890 RepID=UPI0020B81394|nr:DUF58 domain-containing protein [Chromobacterium sp. IIBBL 290-4]UTH72410.1 DUF58 domain-containing protein [Chromobacterium sp. IIBBL 290-4]
MFRFRKRLEGWLLSRLPQEARCELSQRRIYLLPTRFGLLLTGVACAVWVGALNYQVSLAYALAFWIAGLLLVAVLMAYRQLSGLTVEAEAGAAVFAGDECRFGLRVENPSSLPRLLQWHALPDPLARQSRLIPAHGDIRLELAWPSSSRGWLPLPACVLESEAPFGLIRAWAVLRLSCRTLVYPALLPDAERGVSSGEEGAGGPASPEGDDYSHLDVYRHGDAPRQIAWKVLARRDLLTSKRFVGESGARELRISWRDYGPECDLERRLSHLAWRVEMCERRGCRYRLSLPDVEIGPTPGQREQALAALALFGERR